MNKKTSLEMVQEFHTIYRQPIKDEPDLSNPAINKLRIDLIQEELNELKEALETGDVVEALDALTDIQYVLDGAYLSLGLHKHKQAGLEEVHASNLSKLDEDGNPIYNEFGKVLKGIGYRKPDFTKILNK